MPPASPQAVPGFPDQAILCAPGRLGARGAAGVMIFDAGATIFTADLVARFLGEEVEGLQWLRDFLGDTGVIDTILMLEAWEEQEELPEELYSRADLGMLSTALDDT